MYELNKAAEKCESNKTHYNNFKKMQIYCYLLQWCIDGECVYDQVAPSKEGKKTFVSVISSVIMRVDLFAIFYFCFL